jgi:LemA protein
MVVVERYPTLQAVPAFRDLMTQLEGTENRIAVERRAFNQVAQDYNTRVRRFPAALFAGMMGFQPKPYFQATTPGAETAPKVDFGTPAPAATP